MTFNPGHSKIPDSGMPKGKKTYKTVAKEKAREVFEQQQLRAWLPISKAQADAALIDQKAREYTINQVIGKPTETLNVKGIEFDFTPQEDGEA